MGESGGNPKKKLSCLNDSILNVSYFECIKYYVTKKDINILVRWWYREVKIIYR